MKKVSRNLEIGALIALGIGLMCLCLACGDSGTEPGGDSSSAEPVADGSGVAEEDTEIRSRTPRERKTSPGSNPIPRRIQRMPEMWRHRRRTQRRRRPNWWQPSLLREVSRWRWCGGI